MTSAGTYSPHPSEEQTLADLLRDGLFVDGDWVETKDQDPNGEVRLIQLADVGDGVFRDRSARFLTMEKARELRCTFLEPGDVLVARMPEPLGRACIFPGVERPAVTVVDVCIMRPNSSRARSEWLVKAINSPTFRESMQEFVRGTTRQRISRKNLGTLRLTAPSVDEQLSLADFVDSVESKRGAAIDHVVAVRKAIERFSQAVLAAACAGRLTADWRASTSTLAHDSAENGMPAEWSLVPLGELAESIRGGSGQVPRDERTEYPILRSSSVRPFSVDYDDVRFLGSDQSLRPDNFVEEGDLLITRLSGSLEYVGNCALVGKLDGRRIQYPDRLFCCRLQDRVNAPFIEVFFAGPLMRHQIEGASRSAAGHQRISIADLKGFSVALPPVDEQSEIVRRVNELLAVADGLKQRIEIASNRVERSSQAVLAKAFRGELNVMSEVRKRTPVRLQ